MRLGTKEDLRKRFGVAVATVNEAMRLLEAKGMVTSKPGPGGGIFVATPSSRARMSSLMLGFKVDDAPLEDCLTVHTALEPLIYQEAARHCSERDATALLGLVTRLQKRVDDAAGFLRVNWALNRRLARMGRNAPLQTLYLTLLDYVEDGLEGVAGDRTFLGTTDLEAHRELVEAIIAGEPKRLAAAIERHTPLADGLAQQ